MDRLSDPRTEDTITFDLLRTARGAQQPERVGAATFRDGEVEVDAPPEVAVAVEEQLERAFVDRVQADERPRGYRRSGQGMVDMLVPGMPEHFIARMRGLWLSYPDGSVVTARLGATPRPASGTAPVADRSEGPSISDPSVRRATLAAADTTLGSRPLVRAHVPDIGTRPSAEAPDQGPIRRTDCGWIV